MGDNVDLEQLPRYKFVALVEDQGCAAHGDPNCLCDVDLTAKGVSPVRYSPIFGELADEAVGGVNSKNISNWAEILLGCHEEWRKLNKKEQPTGWQLLPEFNRKKLVDCYRRRVRWSEAKIWVPSNIGKDDMKIIAKTYNIRLYQSKPIKLDKNVSDRNTTDM